MGGKTATTTQSVAIPPEVMARYNAVNTRAENVAQQPFQQYGGEFVAPITPTQQLGIGQTIGASQMAQPFYGAATGLTMLGAGSVGALTPEQIAYYQNPYTNAVAASTFEALRQQQSQEMQGATGNAIRSGAFGGDRSGLVAANLARQQQLGMAQAMAPIYQQGYQQAVQTAAGQQGVVAQDLARQLQAGQQLGGLGAAAQGAALQGAQAVTAAGTLEQQTQQAQDTAQYQQFLQERGYPFQVAQFLANIAMGTGALSGSTTTTTQPAPFFSDEREKTNIQKLGKGLYAYDYKADVAKARRDGTPMPPKRVGPMAQEIEKKKPGLVIDINDYKVVDPSRAERAYGGGLDAESMGGAVMEPGAFAPGGLVAPEDMKAILAAQAQFLGPYGQGGLYGGTPHGQVGGGRGIVPQASLPVSKLVTAGRVPQQQPSTFAQLAGGINQTAGLGESLLGDKGLFGEKGLGSKLISGARSAGRSVGLGAAPEAAAPPPASVPAPSTDTSSAGGTSREEEERRLAGQAHGGLIPHEYAAGGMPYGGDPLLQDVISEGKDEVRQLPKPGQPPGAPKGLGSNIMDAAKLGSSLYGLGSAASTGAEWLAALPFFLSTGGTVPRHGYATDGTVDQQNDGGAETGYSTDLLPAAIRKTASEIGVNPLDLATIISYETGGTFDPWQKGPTSRYGLHRGLIQWGEPQRERYGITEDMPVGQQMSAVGEYLRNAGVRPGMGLGDIYSAINAGTVGRPGAVDRGTTVAQKIASPQMARHRQVGAQFLGLNPGDVPAENSAETQIQRSGQGMYVPGGQQGPSEGGFGAAARAILPTTKSPTGEESINWKQTLIPILSGLGAMASSPSRYLGSAILQGLGAGAQSYANLEKQQADIAKTQAQTDEIRQLMAKGDIFITPNGHQMVLLPGGVKIPYGEWLKRNKPPTLSQSRSAPSTPPGQTGVPGHQGSPGTEVAPPSALPKPLVSLADANAERAQREGPKILAQDPTNNPFTVTTQRADAARNDMPQTLQYARALADLPANFSGPIPAQIITPFIQKVNSLLGAVGVPQIPQTGDPVAAKEVIDKIAIGLARARQAGTGGAVAEFEALLRSVPTDWNSKLGQSQLVSSMLAEQRMAQEEDRAYNAYRDYIEKKYGLQGNESQYAGRGLRQAFLEQYQPQFQEDKKILQHMFLNEFKDKQGKPALVVKDVNGTMKPVSVLSYLIQNAGSPGSDKVRKALEAQYGADKVQRILGYFGRQ
jgi:hypothetical protein